MTTYTDLKARLGMVRSDLQGRVDATKLQVIAEALAAIEELEAENARLLDAIYQSIWVLKPYAALAKRHAVDDPDWGPFDSVTARISIMYLRDAANAFAELKGNKDE